MPWLTFHCRRKSARKHSSWSHPLWSDVYLYSAEWRRQSPADPSPVSGGHRFSCEKIPQTHEPCVGLISVCTFAPRFLLDRSGRISSSAWRIWCRGMNSGSIRVVGNFLDCGMIRRRRDHRWCRKSWNCTILRCSVLRHPVHRWQWFCLAIVR